MHTLLDNRAIKIVTAFMASTVAILVSLGRVNAETPVIPPQDVAANSGGTICFYVDSPHFRLTGPYKSIRTGHVFIGLQPDAGPQQGNAGLIYGHVPSGGTPGGLNPFDSSGKTEGQADHPWDYRICYHVDANKYNAAASFVRGELNSPSDFHLFGRNCTDWADRLAKAVGLNIPRTTDPSSPNVKDPVVFEDNLARLRAGSSYEGGTVTRKVVTTLASQFDVNSVYGLGVASLAAPDTLAAGLKVGLVKQVHPPIHIGVGQLLAIIVPDARPGSALISAQFGNQSPIINQLRPNFHSARPGTFPLRVAIIVPRGIAFVSSDVVVAGPGESVPKVVPLVIPPENTQPDD